jgi:hypothetical protein
MLGHVRRLERTLRDRLPTQVSVELALAQCGDGQLYTLWHRLQAGDAVGRTVPLAVQRWCQEDREAVMQALRPIVLRQQGVLARFVTETNAEPEEPAV